MLRSLSASFVALSLLAPSWAWAQAKPAAAADPNADSRALAETLFFAARGLMDAGRVPEACAKFAESYRLDPAPGTLLNLAVCHEREGRIAAAWGEYREARAEARKAGRADREDLANQRIAAIEPDLPWLSIVVPPSVRVAGLDIKRNGVSLQDAAWGTELPVDPGEVNVAASAPGYVSSTVTVAIAKREHKSITITALRAAPKPAAVASTAWSGRKTGGFIALVGGGVAIAGSGVLGLLAANQKSKSDDACPIFDGERRCTSAGSTAMSTAKTLAWAADGAFAAGVISAAIGSYLFFWSPSTEGAPRVGATSPRLSLDVNVAPGSAYAGMRGSF